MGELVRTVRTFGTMTEDLLALSDWLAAANCTHVAMESTGVSWKPLWNLLEGAFALLLVNPRHIKAVPGRKTDVTDAEWIADVLRHGLLRASYVPDRPQRELRELTRDRTSLGRERTAEANRRQKTLEGATITLASVATDILGTSGRAMLRPSSRVPRMRRRCAPGQGKVAGEAPGTGARAEREGHAAPPLHGRRAPAHRDLLEASIDRVSTGRLPSGCRPAPDAGARLDTIPGAVRTSRSTHRRSTHRRNGHGHAPVPDSGAPGQWGGDVPGQPRKRRQETQREDPEGESLAADAAGAGRPCRCPPDGHRPRGAGPTAAARRGKSRAAVAVGHTLLVIAASCCLTAPTTTLLGPTPSLNATVARGNGASSTGCTTWATPCR